MQQLVVLTCISVSRHNHCCIFTLFPNLHCFVYLLQCKLCICCSASFVFVAHLHSCARNPASLPSKPFGRILPRSLATISIQRESIFNIWSYTNTYEIYLMKKLSLVSYSLWLFHNRRAMYVFFCTKSFDRSSFV